VDFVHDVSSGIAVVDTRPLLREIPMTLEKRLLAFFNMKAGTGTESSPGRSLDFHQRWRIPAGLR
jgi:hypothetical protein